MKLIHTMVHLITLHTMWDIIMNVWISFNFNKYWFTKYLSISLLDHDFPNIPGYALPKVLNNRFLKTDNIWSMFYLIQLKKIAPDYYDNLPCHTSWLRVLIDFILDPNMGPKSRIRRTIRSDALKVNNAIDLKNKSKVNEVLHEFVDNNNNNNQSNRKPTPNDNRKLSNQQHLSSTNGGTSKVTPTNGIHSKIEW